uniref:Putative product n=1 Tax=Xenopsylla cheopis TaxID=163159 RepID=A0A6M2DGZ5_XENCH
MGLYGRIYSIFSIYTMSQCSHCLLLCVARILCARAWDLLIHFLSFFMFLPLCMFISLTLALEYWTIMPACNRYTTATHSLPSVFFYVPSLGRLSV